MSLGGPVISYGSALIPSPFLTAAYGYGFTPTLTGFGAVNITSALYGNAQLELGLTKQVLRQRGWVPGLSVSPAATVIYRNKDALKAYPTLMPTRSGTTTGNGTTCTWALATGWS